jgi:hypothetical protein
VEYRAPAVGLGLFLKQNRKDGSNLNLMEESGPHPPPDAHATLVVVGPGDLEQQYAFDALIDDTDGDERY